MTPEGQLKADVLAFLRRTGYFFLRVNSGKVRVKGGFMQLAEEGAGDFIIWVGPRTLWAELKAPGQKTAKDRVIAQAAFRDKALAAGHEYALIGSVDELVEFLKGGPVAGVSVSLREES